MSKTAVNSILNNKQVYLSISEDQLNSKRQQRPPKFDLLEKMLYQWYEEEAANGTAMVERIIKEKAGSLRSSFGVSETDFPCSNGWLQGFKKRYNIPFKHKKDTKNPEKHVLPPDGSNTDTKNQDQSILSPSNAVGFVYF